jgi:glycosyltransferase involved in cell wall biosynthesis
MFLAEHLTRRGLDVTVVTHSPNNRGNKDDGYGFPVHRRPGRSDLLRFVQESDLVYQNNISVNYLWPLLVVRRPLVITHQTPIDDTIEKSALKRWMKMRAMRMASCTSCSQYLADTFSVPSRVIYNPLRSIFKLDKDVERNKDLAFVGRLSDSKGIDVLLRALSLLKAKGVRPSLTIIGGGPKETDLKALGTELRLDEQVLWAGPKQGPEIAQMLNQHQILVVPSRRKPAEALGIVAMEGIACGAIPVAAEQGGLPEAIGPCGLTFTCEDAQSLADALERLLQDAALRDQLRAPAQTFLHRFSEETILEQYLEVFASALPGGKLTYR